MRTLLATALGLSVLGCSLPKLPGPGQAPKPALPYREPGPAPASVSDGSLWQDRPLVSDLRARQLNDLVTIRIAESTSAKVKGDLSTSRVGSNSLKASSFFSRLTPGGTGGTPATSATDTHFKGAGNTGRSAVFTTTITARVVKVLGNGNLIFEGFRDIQLNNEVQRLYVAGMVNPAALDANDSIGSGQVAELRVSYGGQGVVDETTKPGYVSRLLNYVWPY